MATKELVLVTGGSGFLGSYCIIEALNQSHRVRTTVRSLKRADEVRQMLRNGGISREQSDAVEIVEADLSNDNGWPEACEDCTFILHVASPLLTTIPKDPEEVVKPARDGTLRVLKAAKEAGTVRRVVLTSSMGALSYGHDDSNTRVFTESDWSNLSSPRVKPYQRSKTLAERAAWDYISSEGGDIELAVINPYAIFGPVLSQDFAASMEILVRMINGQLPGCPQLYLEIVDVRDVANMHLRAMITPQAKGERFIASSDENAMSFREVSLRLKSLLGDKASKAPTRELPNFMVRLASWFDKPLASVVSELGVIRNTSNAKAKKVLGWQPRNVDRVLKDAAESLFRYDLVK